MEVLSQNRTFGSNSSTEVQNKTKTPSSKPIVVLGESSDEELPASSAISPPVRFNKGTLGDSSDSDKPTSPKLNVILVEDNDIQKEITIDDSNIVSKPQDEEVKTPEEAPAKKTEQKNILEKNFKSHMESMLAMGIKNRFRGEESKTVHVKTVNAGILEDSSSDEDQDPHLKPKKKTSLTAMDLLDMPELNKPIITSKRAVKSKKNNLDNHQVFFWTLNILTTPSPPAAANMSPSYEKSTE